MLLELPVAFETSDCNYIEISHISLNKYPMKYDIYLRKYSMR
jgi:hypothetical protein